MVIKYNVHCGGLTVTPDVLLMVNGECVTSGDSQPPAHALSRLSSVQNAPTSHSVCFNTSKRVLRVSDFILHVDDPSPPASVTWALGVSECEPPCTGSGLTF